MLVGISWNLRTQFFGLYLLFVAVCLSQNAHGMPASRRRRVSVNMFDGVLASIIRPKLHKVNRRSATESFYAEIVNREYGYKWLSQTVGRVRPVLDSSLHRWIICGQEGYLMMAPVPQDWPHDSYHFLQNFYSDLILDPESRPCQIDLSSAENRQRYFQIKRVNKKDVFYHNSSEQYVKMTFRRTEPILTLTNSAEEATEWSFNHLWIKHCP